MGKEGHVTNRRLGRLGLAPGPYSWGCPMVGRDPTRCGWPGTDKRPWRRWRSWGCAVPENARRASWVLSACTPQASTLAWRTEGGDRSSAEHSPQRAITAEEKRRGSEQQIALKWQSQIGVSVQRPQKVTKSAAGAHAAVENSHSLQLDSSDYRCSVSREEPRLCEWVESGEFLYALYASVGGWNSLLEREKTLLWNRQHSG